MKKFGFDPWHYKNTWYDRLYKQTAVAMAQRLAPKRVVEVGCGLGEIIARIGAPLKVGYDIQKEVIEAARFLYGKRVLFRVGSLPDVREKEVDLLIALNWIHELSPAALGELFSCAPCRYLLIDAIKPGQRGYKYPHAKQTLSSVLPKAQLIEERDGGLGEPRVLLLFEMERQ